MHALTHHCRKRYKVLFCCFYAITFSVLTFAQTIPSERRVDWSTAGFNGDIPNSELTLNILDYGGTPDGITDNSAAFTNTLAAIGESYVTILFPPGNYFFSNKIDLKDSIVIRGDGSLNTTLTFDLNGIDDLINIKGAATNLFADFTENSTKGDSIISVSDASIFTSGDYIRISQNDSSLVHSDWAIGTVGQIVQIQDINGNELLLSSELRKDFLLEDHPRIQKLNMITHTGVECLTIKRLDETNPIQSSAIKYNYAVQSWVNGVESENANFAHITIQASSNISITGSYFHDAFDYGGGGRAYGVMIQSTGNECLVENNIFERLRHAMIVQSGANGNVFAYNYSRESFWTGTNFPDDATGDMVCHGNYPFANLFEGNSGQQIVLDNSHGRNGPSNTFFRNRVALYGIFMSSSNSPRQNIIGNEITGGPEDSLGFYFIQGADHFEYANNQRGNIIPDGTSNLDLNSFYSPTKPDFHTNNPYPSIGLPNSINTGILPAQERWQLEEQKTICQNSPGNLSYNNTPTNSFKQENNSFNIPILWNIFPYSTSRQINIDLKRYAGKGAILQIQTALGQTIFEKTISKLPQDFIQLNVEEFNSGIYFLTVQVKGKRKSSKLFFVKGF